MIIQSKRQDLTPTPRRHADFMADQFGKAGIESLSVHAESQTTRSEALEQLSSGAIKVLFSVDLFNEGVDVPSIDTVMMLRPTESSVLFLQQLGRGLRTDAGKEHLVVLDFVGNHHSFLNRPQLLLAPLLGSAPNRRELLKAVKESASLLPDGCFVNYDLEFVDILKSLAANHLSEEYFKLRDSLQRRPTLTEMWRSGSSLLKLRQQYGSWWEFLDELGETTADEAGAIEVYGQWFRDLTTTKVAKSYKLVLLQTLLEHHAIQNQVTVQQLAEWSYDWFVQREGWQADLPDSMRPITSVPVGKWLSHWRSMPIKFWCTPEASGDSWFRLDDMNFSFQQSIAVDSLDTFARMTQDILDWRFAQYKDRLPQSSLVDVTTTPDYDEPSAAEPQLPFFPNIRIACGHFKTGSAEVEELVRMPAGFGALSQARHFIARASGSSMNGGRNPIQDGDYLLLEQITSSTAGSITGDIVAIERQDASGDNQYLLRKVLKDANGQYILRANNPDYADLQATEEMATFARLKGVIDPLELFVGKSFMREEIPSLFGVEFNPGNWQSGHVVLAEQGVHVLLVTLNKQGKSQDHRYHDYFIDPQHFHWQSQNSTTPESKKGRALIDHESKGTQVHLFVRDHKLLNGKAAPFRYYGQVTYLNHSGRAPMSIEWEVGAAG
jgi:SOS-response transcriptional repressor LexA